MKEKQILQDSIQAHQQAIDKAKSELAKIDKPKLRHGEIRYWPETEQYCTIDLSEKGLIWCIWLVGDLLTAICQSAILNGSNHVGHIKDFFDNLKRNSEDLTEFVVSNTYKNRGHIGIGITNESTNQLYFTVKEDGRHNCLHVDIATATEIHQKLGQLIATAKRKANGQQPTI